MKKKDLEEKIKEIEKEYPNYKINNTEMFNLQHEINKLFIQIIRDFNEETELCNRRLLICNIIIGFFNCSYDYRNYFKYKNSLL